MREHLKIKQRHYLNKYAPILLKVIPPPLYERGGAKKDENRQFRLTVKESNYIGTSGRPCGRGPFDVGAT